MKKSLIIFLIFLLESSIAFVEAEQTNDNAGRVKVATIGKKIIYFDEIKAEDWLLDKVNSFEQEKAGLKLIIENEILRNKIAAYGIKPTREEVENQAELMTEKEWKMLGPTEDAREKILETIRYKMSKINEGLNIWKKDKEQGDLFAKQELEPLGIDSYIWDWYTLKSDDPEFLKMVKNSTKYDKEMFRKERLNSAKHVVEIEQLKKAVLPNIPVSDEEILRLFEIAENTEWLDIVTIFDSREVLEKTRKKLIEKDPKELESIKRYRKLHLTGPDLELNEANIWYKKYLFLLAINCASIAPGSISNLFECTTSNGKSTCLFYIFDRKIKDNTSKIKQDVKLNLKNQIEEHKRYYAFESWLSEKMKEETIIHLEKYQRIFDN